MLPIQKFQIKYNTSKRTQPIKYICLHYTGNSSKGSGALMHYNYFNSGNRNSSADIFIDDSNIIQINDYNKNFTWAVGNGKGSQGITNANSVSIEMCINSDGDFNKTLLNTIEFTRYLMKELNIDINHVVRHYDCGGDWKKCPAMFAGTPEKDKLWLKFKTAVLGYEAIIKANTSDPNLWHSTINNNKEGILTFLPNLIEKIYVYGIMDQHIKDWQEILDKCLDKPDEWKKIVPTIKYLDVLLTKIYNV